MDANDAIQRGNEGIDIGVWTGPPANPDPVKHLPGHEHGVAGARGLRIGADGGGSVLGADGDAGHGVFHER